MGLFPTHIANATADDNFEGEKCDSCPHRINPFEMNTITNDLKFSPKGGPHEHYRSTGIRDGGVFPNKFDAAEGACVPFGGVWDLNAITCMADFWDSDPGCNKTNTAPRQSNDVDINKRPAGCCVDVPEGEPCCESTAQNQNCRSQLHGTITFLFDSYKNQNDNVSIEDWRGLWVDLCIPGDNFCIPGDASSPLTSAFSGHAIGSGSTMALIGGGAAGAVGLLALLFFANRCVPSAPFASYPLRATAYFFPRAPARIPRSTSEPHS